MELATAASFFDNVTCQDTFVPTTKFLAQLDLFDDSRRDGATVVRRILSVDPAIVVPARRVITIHGEQWIIGGHQPDSYRGAVVRSKYVIQRAQGACSIRTSAQALSSGSVASYAASLWVKDMREIEISSKLSAFFNIYLPSTETVNVSDVLTLAGRGYIVRNVFLSAAGFLVAETDQLEIGAIQSATYTPYSYTAATDVMAAGAPVTLQLLRLRFQDDYEYVSASAPKLEPGDIRAFILKGVTLAVPKPSDQVALTDGAWLVHSISDEVGCWGLHLRRAPA